MTRLSLDEIALPDDEPADDQLTVEIDPDLYARWQHARDMAKQWTEDAAAARAEIELALGDRETATVNGVTVIRWYWRKVNKFRQAKLKADHPDVVAAYTELAEERRFEPVGE